MAALFFEYPQLPQGVFSKSKARVLRDTNLPIAIAIFAPVTSAVPTVVAFHLMAAMFSSPPPPVRIITSSLATVLILLRHWHVFGYPATTRIQRKNHLTNAEHKNKSYYRTDSSGHKLIPPG